MRIRPARRVAIVFAAALFLLVSAAPARAASLFPNPVYAVGTNPYGMARADFDGDGHADLIVANSTQEYYNGGTGDLSLLRGLGDGTFAPETRIPVSHHPGDVETGDFDGDGHADLVIGYYNGAAVLFGHGDGTFGAEQPLAGGAPAMAHVAHFNADGRADLLQSATISGALQVRALLGQADGTFVAGPLLPSGNNVATAADFNGDGIEDVVATTLVSGCPSTNTVRVYQGDGTGAFSQTGSFTTGVYNDGFHPADLDGDGHVDLIISAIQYTGCSGYSGRRIYWGNGDSTFTAAGPFEVQINTYDLVAADLDHDGNMDWLDTDSGAIYVHLGHGDRTFTDLPWMNTGSNALILSAGDDDGDGELDLAVLANFSEAVFTYLGNGDGTFGPHPIPALATVSPKGAATADFDGDGSLDLAASLVFTGEVAVALGTGTGGFETDVRYAVGTGPDDLVTADFNDDGHPDIAVTVDNWAIDPPTSYPDGSLVLLINNGDGTFAPAATYAAGKNPIALATGDFDGDGTMDVVVANWGGGSLDPADDGDLSLYLGHGDGTLQAQVRLPVGVKHVFPWDPTTPVGLATGDFNGDAHLDIVVAMRGTNNSAAEGDVEILYGDGSGGFDPYVTVLAVHDAESVAVGDLDGDGHTDIAVADMASQQAYDPGGVRVLLSHGDGTFTPSALLAAGPGPFDVRIEDFNLDGVADLAVNNNGGFLALLPGLGGGTFGPHLDFGLFGVPLAIVQGDFDGDGSPDLLVLTDGGAYLYRNTTAPIPPPTPLAITGSLSLGEGGSRKTATLHFTTNAERDLTGFNIVARDKNGDVRLNAATIPCVECTSGAGHEYAWVLAKHKNVQTLYVEALHTDGSTELFGPIDRAAGGAGSSGRPSGPGKH
jgi:hypothetical protein